MIGLTVVGNPAATVMTSSPIESLRSPSDGEVRHERAARLAEDPELTSAAHAHEGGKFAFELSGKAAGSEPSVKRGFDQKFKLGAVKTFARHGHAAVARHERR